MSEAVKTWDRAKPFKRINNDAFLPKAPPDGDGRARGCQIPADYPERKQQFDDEFKNYKPDGLQNLIHTLHVIASTAKAGLIAIGALAAGIGAIAVATAIDTLIDDILNFTENAIKSLLHDIGFRIMEQAIRVLPHWVPVVDGAGNDRADAKQTIEVEGLAKRSYMNPIDVPFRQWHLWFNWNILVSPEPDYQNALSPAHNPPNTDGMDPVDEKPLASEVDQPNTIEVQWDAGALWDQNMRQEIDKGVDQRPGQMVNFDGPMFVADWAWPLKDSYVWAAGRWVYDCSRTTDTDPPLMCSMLNPCKALATARWGAFKFEENEFAVPAIQFMFFACKRGGYIDYDTIRDQDYEFILDLPLLELEPRAPLPICHTGNFPHNTIVLRPRLLMDVNQKPFSWASTAAIEPIVTPIRPDDPQKPPSQVKVRVPLTSLPDKAEACGFILSLGWFDPNFELAKKVKVCKVKFTGASGLRRVRNSIVRTLRDNLNQQGQQLMQIILQQVNQIQIPVLGQLGNSVLAGPAAALVQRLVTAVLDFLEETSPGHSEHWLFRMGVNGQWHAYYRDYVPFTEDGVLVQFGPPPEFDLLLSEDDLLAHAVNGADFGPVGRLMLSKPGARTLQVDGKTPTWPEIVTPDPDPGKAHQAHLKMAIAYAIRLLHLGPQGLGLGIDNQPLGFLDPLSTERTGPPNPAIEGRQNPIIVSRAGNVVSGSIEAPFFARAIDPEKILVEVINIDDPKNKDYEIYFDVSIQDQPLRKPTQAAAGKP